MAEEVIKNQNDEGAAEDLIIDDLDIGGDIESIPV